MRRRPSLDHVERSHFFLRQSTHVGRVQVTDIETRERQVDLVLALELVGALTLGDGRYQAVYDLVQHATVLIGLLHAESAAVGVFDRDLFQVFAAAVHPFPSDEVEAVVVAWGVRFGLVNCAG